MKKVIQRSGGREDGRIRFFRLAKLLEGGLFVALMGLSGCGTTAGPIPLPAQTGAQEYPDIPSVQEKLRKGAAVVIARFDGPSYCETHWVSGFNSDWMHDPQIRLQKKALAKTLRQYGAEALVISQIHVEHTLIVPFLIGAFFDRSKGCVRLVGKAVRFGAH